MKVYRLEVMVIDFDQCGEQGIKDAIEGSSYPNDCLSPQVKSIDCQDIGEWHDDHPLNKNSTAVSEYRRLFPQ